jgi:hypothetical protein
LLQALASVVCTNNFVVVYVIERELDHVSLESAVLSGECRE